MKVLMVIESLRKGGKERRSIELLKFFNELDNIEVCLVLLKEIVDYPIINELKNIKVVIFKRRIKKDPLILLKLNRLIKRFQPDLVHSWGAMPSVYLILLCKLNKVPLINAMVADCYFPFFGKNWRRAKLTFPFSKCIISNSFSGLSSYNVPVEKGRVIYNGVHLDRFAVIKKDYIKKQFNITTENVIGMVAAFHPRKDYETFLRAAIEIAQKDDSVTFVCVGDGPLLNNMKRIVPEAIRKQVLFLGKQDNIEEIINMFDIGVLTSFGEGISNSIIEYMALGKPVVATQGGGTPEIVDPNINGYIIQTRSHRELRKYLEYLLENKEKREDMGKCGKYKIERGFSIKRMADSYLELYEDVLTS